jgi:hypothetical protein
VSLISSGSAVACLVSFSLARRRRRVSSSGVHVRGGLRRTSSAAASTPAIANVAQDHRSGVSVS